MPSVEFCNLLCYRPTAQEKPLSVLTTNSHSCSREAKTITEQCESEEIVSMEN